ncbi:hypothetical protein BU16DRAFT_285940 [Lophium mytilinum]|uniref:CCHC-type domain-containing protein n=1 Tax=Lophium mytilinum TaxID=390894 RepID=A0A6A6R189_9PEZI|nr:hypothetical protein BU16DRAFT_285940 [Lophium mytilinum]
MNLRHPHIEPSAVPLYHTMAIMNRKLRKMAAKNDEKCWCEGPGEGGQQPSSSRASANTTNSTEHMQGVVTGNDRAQRLNPAERPISSTQLDKPVSGSSNPSTPVKDKATKPKKRRHTELCRAKKRLVRIHRAEDKLKLVAAEKAAGNPPPARCQFCSEAHWKVDCPSRLLPKGHRKKLKRERAALKRTMEERRTLVATEKAAGRNPAMPCGNCSGEHRIEDCPEPEKLGIRRVESEAPRKVCRNCSGHHWQRDCPNLVMADTAVAKIKDAHVAAPNPVKINPVVAKSKNKKEAVSDKQPVSSRNTVDLAKVENLLDSFFAVEAAG